MTFDPGRDVDEMRKARGVALGESIGAEPLNLIEAPFGKLAVIAAIGHAFDHLLFEGALVVLDMPETSPLRAASGWHLLV